MNTDASTVEDINIPQIMERLSMSCIASSGEWSNIFRNRSFTLFKNDRDLREKFDSVAVSESISSSMTNLSYTTCRQCSILRSLMSWRPSQVSPFLVAAHLTSSEVRSDFQIWFSPGFPMQSRQARSDPSRGIVIPNSSSALILLWLFLHLHLLVFFSTSLQDKWWNWNGWCWTNTKDDSIHHVWNFTLSVCLRLLDLDLGVQIDSIKQPIKSNSVGSGNMSHCRASLLYDHLDHCFVVFKDIQQSFLTRRIHVWGNKINIVWIINLSMNFLSRWRFIRVTQYLIILMRGPVKNCEDQIP